MRSRCLKPMDPAGRCWGGVGTADAGPQFLKLK